VERPGVAVVRVARGGRLLDATPTAAALLVRYFVSSAPNRGRLPDPVRAWVRRQTSHRAVDCGPRQPMTVEKQGRKLVLTLAGSSGRPLLLMEERASPMEGRSLRTLGLTDREADVLRWVARGKTDAETGGILGISRRTVGKHLQHVFEKLAVATRTAAAARALEALRGELPTAAD
jgi:DNA-binding CsgD family transcriptional regulator